MQKTTDISEIRTANMTDEYFAHSRTDTPPGPTWELLTDHLIRVAEMAGQFASEFDSREWGYLAGLWHDLGKFRAGFQRRIRGSKEQIEHAGAGALLAQRHNAVPIAFAIAGHHAGLANRLEHSKLGLRPLRDRLLGAEEALTEVTAVAAESLLTASMPAIPPFLKRSDEQPEKARLELWTRFVFSALVDADFLATEAFYATRERAPASTDSIESLGKKLDAHLVRFIADSPVNQIRAEVLEQCRFAASQPPGLFSVTVPTGGGKTLSALAFALAHARIWGHRRVISVAPFTSVVEQTAGVYRDVVGACNVIEHHSAFDEARAKDENAEVELKRRLAAENWDAPVIVSTAVQFFESLFANKTSRCRKLHNIANSVVILDEAQTIPTDFLLCIIDVLKGLAADYHCTILLCTATQPALDARDALPQGLKDVREIMTDPGGLSMRLRRVSVEWPRAGNTTSYAELAQKILSHECVLVVTHRRNDAKMLADMLPSNGSYHLSALMCAAHRSEVLSEVKRQLRSGSACRLVSTQLIEAGVDIDFPIVYRAMAGLDSLSQSAGRCNREGRLPGLGRFVVYNAETSPPPGNPKKGAQITASMLSEYGGTLDIWDQNVLREYFRRLYQLADKDRYGVVAERDALNFANVAEKVLLVDDGFSRSVVVPWADASERLTAFRSRPGRDTQRALQPYIVQVRVTDVERLLKLGALEPVGDTDLFAVTELRSDLYHARFGLLVEQNDVIAPERLVM
jgi:CRISPR-associated endonuclease/helicase Cas3